MAFPAVVSFVVLASPHTSHPVLTSIHYFQLASFLRRVLVAVLNLFSHCAFWKRECAVISLYRQDCHCRVRPLELLLNRVKQRKVGSGSLS